MWKEKIPRATDVASWMTVKKTLRIKNGVTDSYECLFINVGRLWSFPLANEQPWVHSLCFTASREILVLAIFRVRVPRDYEKIKRTYRNGARTEELPRIRETRVCVLWDWSIQHFYKFAQDKWRERTAPYFYLILSVITTSELFRNENHLIRLFFATS